MIKFLKNLLKKVNFKSDNENINKYNKIIYTIIILCAIAFIGVIIYFVVKNWPDFIQAIQDGWEDSKEMLKQ